MDKQVWYIYTVEYYSAIKRIEVLTHVTIWVNLENIMRKWEKAGMKDDTLYGTVHVACQDKQSHKDRKVA